MKELLVQKSTAELSELIKYHRDRYWAGEPEISDHEYDQLIETLKAIDPNNSLLSDIEYCKNASLKVTHDQPMLSLEKKYSFQDVISWITKVSRPTGDRFKIQPKYDGVASIYYADNKILATRGDGSQGEDISLKLPLIELISPKYSSWEEVDEDLLGEIIITNSNFKSCKYTKKSGEKYKTPRNLTAGILNLKDISNVVGKVCLSFIDYDLESLSLRTIDITDNVFKNILSKIKACDYPTDGVVFKLEDEEYGNSLGYTDHHYRKAIAYKPEDLGVETILEDVILQHGKAKLTPVAILKPVVINGVEIKRASLHNAKFLLDKDIHIGDILEIIRSNDVIPYVLSVTPGANRIPLIFAHCSICGADIRYKEPDLYCSNSECTGNLAKKLLDSVKSLNIVELGLPTIEKMITDLGVNSILDIMNLSKREIFRLDGFGDVSAGKLFDNIQSIQKTTINDYQILAAINIPGIGKGLSKTLLERYNLDELSELTIDQLVTIPGVGLERAITISESLVENKRLLSDLKNIFIIDNSKKMDNSNEIPKLKICFSGTFSLPKEHYKKIAKAKNFEVVDTVTKDVSYLVTAGAQTSKVSQAKRYDIPILEVDEFMSL
jgi:DNA ligase (NAD+)